MLDGKVMGDCMPQHRHQEFIGTLKRLDTRTPAEAKLHLTVDNHDTHKHPSVHLLFTPASSSRLNLVERWFRDLAQQRIQRCSFHATKEMITTIKA